MTDTLVNTFTTSNQNNPAVAIDADGDFVVTWQSSDQDGDGNGIYAQRYNASGVAQGSEFLVNTFTTSYQSNTNRPNLGLSAVSNGGIL